MQDVHDDTSCMMFVSEERRQKIKRFLRQSSKKHSLVSELLVRYILMKKQKINNQEICFETNAYGKPYVKGIDSFYFNISHSGDYVAVLCGGTEVGCDIEQKYPDDALNLAERFFTKEEYHILQRLPEHKQTTAFGLLWTLKESYIKYKGKGLSIPLDSFSFSDALSNLQWEESKDHIFLNPNGEKDIKLKTFALHQSKLESNKKADNAGTKTTDFQESPVRGMGGASCAKLESNKKADNAGTKTTDFQESPVRGMGGASCAKHGLLLNADYYLSICAKEDLADVALRELSCDEIGVIRL